MRAPCDGSAGAARSETDIIFSDVSADVRAVGAAAEDAASDAPARRATRVTALARRAAPRDRRGTARRVALASAGHAREANIGPIVVDETRPAPGVTACERLRLRESCAVLRAVGERGVAVDCARGRNSDSRSSEAVVTARSGE